ncbi:polysaccharide deacetylase family protein [Paenibacillus sp. FJAT-27812]|uniref:polysaccharide deacetylase family protein n=1 Tax=Paenibacillus sp. FJAT-27812 TaxID=1684143 RepID=UPI001E2FE895|nr:polysaccharide deacetylase family protein [Paenibacillus sp. FJAT-27812]
MKKQLYPEYVMKMRTNHKKKLPITIILMFLVLLSACGSNSSSISNNVQPPDDEVDARPENPLSIVKQSSDKNNGSGKTIYLTFDDGPSSATPDILDTLKLFDAKATFFMLEPKMKESPDLVKRIVDEGHAVALHGVTHNKHRFYLSEQTALDEMDQAQHTLKEITGITSDLIRTPYGSIPYLTDSYRKVLDDNGYKLWDWNVDSSDWSSSNAEFIESTISQINRLEKGDVTPIVLMHDVSETASHLINLLTYLQKEGFVTKTLDSSLEPYNFNCYDRCKRVSIES